MTWFEELTGFQETGPEQVRRNLIVDGPRLISKANGRTMAWGRLETPTLKELWESVRGCTTALGKFTVRELVADVQSLHTNKANAGALFQVASQFNLLEMISPSISPEQGVGRYENDRTQGPSCAVAAGAGTIYRNYFAPVNGQQGQTAERQIDCLADLGKALGNTNSRFWRMRNGYALPSEQGLLEIADKLQASDEEELDALRQLLRIGIQWDTQVTLDKCSHLVSQVYCSALPVAYTNHPPELWEPFAKLVLEAAYEATLCAAVLHHEDTGNRRVYLTLLGGGAFGNQTAWIMDAAKRALTIFKACDLDVAIVSYRDSKAHVRQLAAQFGE
ncbi:MAG: hypothetical protein ACTFAK_17125 [Candidatus Electronema sp. VV]